MRPVSMQGAIFLKGKMMMANKTVRRIVRMGLMTAVSVILVYFICFPIFPAVSFLEYDPADIPILFSTLSFGALDGLLLTLTVSVIQGLTVSAKSGIIGILMHFLATGSFVLVTGLTYKLKKTTIGAILSLVAGVAAMTITMALWNLIFTPIFMGAPRAAVIKLLPLIIAFNLIKAGANAVVSFIVFKAIKRRSAAI